MLENLIEEFIHWFHLVGFLKEYNATVEFLWAPLLVDSNSDDPVNHRLSERIIRPDSVLRHAAKWEHADILVFNSYLWWRQGPVKLLSVTMSWKASESQTKNKMKQLGGMNRICLFVSGGLLRKTVNAKSWTGLELWSLQCRVGQSGWAPRSIHSRRESSLLPCPPHIYGES